MSNLRTPSIKSLMQIKDVTREDAIRIRVIIKGPSQLLDSSNPRGESKLQRIDRILRTYGVEYIPAGHNAKSPGIHYCNAGDTYATTLMYVCGHGYRVGCWGDIVERGNYD
jgi:hypothetical protein